ncbi:MAG: hypothetical protein ACD_79C01506G0002 [uncultured bacterium]|nr:MAG: hypothetical protein ACD_79C01506G0002 [uncultured bacterium]
MIKNLIIVFMFFCSLFLFAEDSENTEEKKESLEPYSLNQRYMMMVNDFEVSSKNEEYQYLGEKIADKLINEIFKYQRYRIIERKRMKLILDELSFQQSGFADKDFMTKVGNQLGAELLLTGSVTDISKKSEKKSIGIASKIDTDISVKIEARVILIRTGEIMAISSWDGKDKVSDKRALVAVKQDKSEVDAVIDELVTNAVDKIAFDLSKNAPVKE